MSPYQRCLLARTLAWWIQFRHVHAKSVNGFFDVCCWLSVVKGSRSGMQLEYEKFYNLSQFGTLLADHITTMGCYPEITVISLLATLRKHLNSVENSFVFAYSFISHICEFLLRHPLGLVCLWRRFFTSFSGTANRKRKKNAEREQKNAL